MNWSRPALDLRRVRVRPLAERRSLTSVEEVLVDPSAIPEPVNAGPVIDEVASRIRRARHRAASVMLMYGAHLVKNGAALIVNQPCFIRGLLSA